MAVASVAFDGTRIDGVDGGSSASNIGGGSGSGGEPDIVYQGTGATPEDRSRKVGTGASGFAINTTITDISTGSGTYQTLVLKFAAGNWAALESVATPGMEARIGSGTSAYAQYDFAGVDAYPEKGGFVFLCADPNIAGYRTATVGSPALGSADYFGIVGDFTATSKSENLVMSAIDVGNGYIVTGGGGADPTADYQDVADFNSILANRHGFFAALEGKAGAFNQYGKIQWGTAATAVDHQPAGNTVVYLADGFYAAGWARTVDNIENAASVISPTGRLTVISEGNTTTTDTRGVYELVGSAGTHNRQNLTLVNHAQVILGSAGTWSNFDWETADLSHNGGTLNNGVIRCTALSGVAVCDDLILADVTNIRAVQAGAGHFANLGTIAASTSIDWTVGLEGFAVGTTGDPVTTTTAGDEAILVNVASGQKLTINVAAGAGTPSVKNDGPGTVAVVVPEVSVTFVNMAIGGEFRIYDDDGDANPITIGTNREGVETLAATTYTLTHSSAEAGGIIYAQFIDPLNFEEQVVTVTLSANDQTVPFDLQPEENV